MFTGNEAISRADSAARDIKRCCCAVLFYVAAKSGPVMMIKVSTTPSAISTPVEAQVFDAAVLFVLSFLPSPSATLLCFLCFSPSAVLCLSCRVNTFIKIVPLLPGDSKWGDECVFSL